ncbi:hypothetical protein M408DRAFT_28197 [Serendipita vermifera MAFF 305830]|uniref:G domain-containing protein n=1 Tax=Serendipita vermifera MAFF 305830 TaxID=933852 RepID=A0A0C3AST1_SERVB|nr:hypothetical protein M408DRAFT_28197 [Serendipita vermifera MAFF 305830]
MERDTQADEQDPMLVVVMGATGSGKTTFINLASNAGFKVGHKLRSCTASVQQTQTFPLDDRDMILIDTPGFDDTEKPETEVLDSLASYLRDLHGADKKVTGILYLHDISSKRMGGMARKNFELFRKLCGTKALKNVIIVTTMWDQVDSQVGAAREEELKTDEGFFELALREKAGIRRHDGTLESAQCILRSFFGNKPVPLRIQVQMVLDKLSFADKEVGQLIRALFLEQEKRHREEMERLKKVMLEASEQGRREMQEALDKE